MVATDPPFGLIATVRAASSPALDGVASCCGWPVLLGASPRSLGGELTAANYECVLFWLDDAHAVEATARLIAWARQRGARPLRMAAAIDEDGSVEPMLRSAGAHGFIPIQGQSVSAIAAAIAPLLTGAARAVTPHVRHGPAIVTPASARVDHARPP